MGVIIIGKIEFLLRFSKVVSAIIIGILLLAAGSTSVYGASANYAPTSTGGNMPLYSGASASLVPWVEDPNMWDTYTFQILSQPSNGSANILSNELQYTPARSYTGTDNFTYQVEDQGGNTISGSAAVRVYSPGDLSNCKGISTVYSSGVNSGQIQTLVKANPCTFYSISNTRVTNTGAQVTMDYFINWPSSGTPPKAVVVLIGGADLNMSFSGDTTTGVPLGSGGGNFVVRTAQMFADAGYLTIAINKPSDQPPAGTTDTTAAAGQYRISVNHAVDILTILKYINTDNLDVFISGTSCGAISAVALNLIAAGISISSPVTSDPNPTHVSVGEPGVPNLQPSFVSRPVHVLWNLNDLCTSSVPGNSQALYISLLSVTPTRNNLVTGGVRVTVPGGGVSASNANDVCGPFDYHGYLGIETTAVGYITSWLDAQVSSLSGIKRPEAAFATITAAGGPVSIDLSTLTRDQAGYTMSYALSHTVSSLGGSVRISGSTATYTPPVNAGSMTDYFVYVVTDGRGGVNAAVITVQNGAYSLAVSSNGSGDGTLTTSSAGITCGGGVCSGISGSGSTAVITATAAAGSVFTGWSGCDNVDGNNCSVTIDSARSVTATFAPCPYTLTPSSQSVNASGGSGSVSINTPSSCPWTASGNLSWFTITSGNSGTGNGMLSYSVSANTGTNERTGSITIAGQIFSMTQAGEVSGNIIEVGSAGTFPTIQSGYSNAGNGGTIQVQAGLYGENDIFSSNLSVSLTGGYDSTFSINGLYSSISGTLIIRNGTVTVGNITIQ